MRKLQEMFLMHVCEELVGGCGTDLHHSRVDPSLHGVFVFGPGVVGFMHAHDVFRLNFYIVLSLAVARVRALPGGELLLGVVVLPVSMRDLCFKMQCCLGVLVGTVDVYLDQGSPVMVVF